MSGSGFQGADTGAMADLAGAMGAAGEAMRTIAEHMTGLVERIRGGCWTGPDAEAFDADLTGAARHALGAGELLEARGREVGAHAEEQEEASRAEDADAPGGGARPVGSGRGGPREIPAAPQMLVMPPGQQERIRAWLEEHVPGAAAPHEEQTPAPTSAEERLGEWMLR